MWFDGISAYNSLTYTSFVISTSSNPKYKLQDTDFSNGAFVTTGKTGLSLTIEYFNDTEIT